MEAVCWTVGPEYETELFERLGRTLQVFGYEGISRIDAVAGSQDITCWKVSGADGDLTIKSETYIGLTVEGPPNVVSRVRKHFERQPSNLQLNSDTFGAR